MDTPAAPKPVRRFYLWRTEDESGISGTGRVAEGVEFPDGKCALWWHISQSIGIYLTLARMLHVHGHGGRTEVRYD